MKFMACFLLELFLVLILTALLLSAAALLGPECWKEDESSRSSETSTCLCPCPFRTALLSHRGTICLPTFPLLSPPGSSPPPLPPIVAITRGKKGELASVNMPGWRSQWRLVLLNSLTCGLEICVAAGITYVPPLLLEAGVEERYMTMVLGKGLVKTNRVTLQVYVSECQFTCLCFCLSLSHTHHSVTLSISDSFWWTIS